MESKFNIERVAFSTLSHKATTVFSHDYINKHNYEKKPIKLDLHMDSRSKSTSLKIHRKLKESSGEENNRQYGINYL